MTYNEDEAMRQDIDALAKAAAEVCSEVTSTNCVLPASVHFRISLLSKAVDRAQFPLLRLGHIIRERVTLSAEADNG